MSGGKLLTPRLPEAEEGSEQAEAATFSKVAAPELHSSVWSEDQAALE